MKKNANESCCDMRGLLSFLILFLLSKKPMHGQEIANELERRKGIRPSPGTIYPALKVGLFKNKYLIFAVLSSFTITVFAVFMPSFRDVMGMAKISILEFLAIMLISSIGAVVIEVSKYLKKEKIIQS